LHHTALPSPIRFGVPGVQKKETSGITRRMKGQCRWQIERDSI
jgi:hypothetical protein